MKLSLANFWKKLHPYVLVALCVYLWLCGIYLDETRVMTVIDTTLATLCTIFIIDHLVIKDEDDDKKDV